MGIGKKLKSNKHKTVNQSSEAVVSSLSKQPKSVAKTIYSSLLIAIVIVIASVVVYEVHKPKNNVTKPATSQLTAAQAAQNYANHNQYAKAEQVWQNQLTGATNDQKAAIYYQQSALAIQFKQYTAASNYDSEAKSVTKVDTDYYAAQAALDQAEGNNNAAVTAYQDAINALPTTAPGYNLIVLDYQHQMEALQ